MFLANGLALADGNDLLGANKLLVKDTLSLLMLCVLVNRVGWTFSTRNW